MVQEPTSPAAVVDVGSHSVRLAVGERAGERVRVLDMLRRVLPLGRDAFDQGTISAAVTGGVIAILRDYRRVLDEYGIAGARVIATTAVREATNREVFTDTVRRRTGFAVEVLTPGDVAYYFDAYIWSALRDRLPVHERNILVVELGAGSLDFSLMRRGAVLATAGLPLGMMRLGRIVDRAGAAMPAARVALGRYVASQFAGLRRSLPRVGIDSIVFASEELGLALSRVLSDSRFEAGFLALAPADSRRFHDACAAAGPDQLQHDHGLPAEIAQVAGNLGVAVVGLIGAFQPKNSYVLETPLGEAVLNYMLLDLGRAERYDRQRQLLSVARSLCYKYGADVRHAQQVARLARRLFAGLQGLLGLEPGDLGYLLLAAWLHDIGRFVADSAHHKHSEYLINNLNLFRLSDEDVRVVACTARYHRGAAPRTEHSLYAALNPNHQVLVQKLAALLRVADALDHSHSSRIRSVAAVLNGDGIIRLVAEAEDELVLERTALAEKRGLLEDVSGCSLRLVVARPGR